MAPFGTLGSGWVLRGRNGGESTGKADRGVDWRRRQGSVGIGWVWSGVAWNDLAWIGRRGTVGDGLAWNGAVNIR